MDDTSLNIFCLSYDKKSENNKNENEIEILNNEKLNIKQLYNKYYSMFK